MIIQSISNKIINGDAFEVLKTMPSDYVHCIVTSPPYWGLRDYGKKDQLGLESDPNEYVDKLTDIFSEAKRVLRHDGTLWLNIGDSYARQGGDSSKKGRHWDGREQNPNTGHNRYADKIGLKPKDLVGIPWRIAFALRSYGWYLRQDIIWSKPNPIPESVKDRCTKSHEHVFLFSKSSKYYFDSYAIREKTSNKRDVWSIAGGNYGGAHFAAFPQNLVIPCVRAGSSEHGCCSMCGDPYKREIEMTEEYKRVRGEGWKGKDDFKETGMRGVGGMPEVTNMYKTTGWKKNCECDADVSPCIVMDIFMGSGTTAFVSKRLGRRYLGIELNEEYVEIANNRLTQEELFI